MSLPTVIEPVGMLSLTIGSYTFCAVSIGAIGVDGGDPIDTTTLCNVAWVTKMAQTLKEVPDMPFTAWWDPTDFATIAALVNVNSQCVLTITAVGTITFWGHLRSWTPGETGKGEGVKTTGVIVISNRDNSNNEVGPVFA